MKRHFPGLHVEPRSDAHLPAVVPHRAPPEALLHSQLHSLGPQSSLSQDCGTTLLQPEVPLETELVSAGFSTLRSPDPCTRSSPTCQPRSRRRARSADSRSARIATDLDGWREKKAARCSAACFENSFSVVSLRRTRLPESSSMTLRYRKLSRECLTAPRRRSGLEISLCHILQRTICISLKRHLRHRISLRVLGPILSAVVVFVGRRTRDSVSEEPLRKQRREFGQLVETTASQIEAGQFLPPAGVGLWSDSASWEVCGVVFPIDQFED